VTDMAEPTSRIEAAHSFPGSEERVAFGRSKEKPRPHKTGPRPEVPIDADESEDQERHELDTLA